MDKEKQISFQRDFGLAIRRLRQEKNLTQMQLAVRSETDIRQIQRIEAGEIATSIIQAYLIAKSLEVTLDDLTNFDLT